MEWYYTLCWCVLLFYVCFMGLTVLDTNRRVKHIESEFTLEGGK